MTRSMLAKVGILALTGMLVLALTSCQSDGTQDEARALPERQTQKTVESESEPEGPDEETLAVIDSINAVGEVTLDSESSIKQARKAYNALSAGQREFVDNYTVLEEAEVSYGELVEAAEEAKRKFAVGDNVTNDDFSVTLTRADVTDVLDSSESSTYWEPDGNAVFVLLEFDVEALNSEQLPIDDFAITNLVANYGSNTYKDWNLQYIANELWLYIRHTYFDANMPVRIYAYTTIPSSAANDNESLSVDMTIAGQEKHLVLR